MSTISLLRNIKSKVAPRLVLNREPLDQKILELRRQLAEVAAERDTLLSSKSGAWDDRHADRMLHHHPHRLSGKVVVSAGGKLPNDISLVERVTLAYRKAVRTPIGSTNSIWLNEFSRINGSVHNILDTGASSEAAELFRNPAASTFFYGFDSLQSFDAPRNVEAGWMSWQHRTTYDNLLQLSRAIGARRVENPETGIDFIDTPPVEEILEQLDEKFGFKVDFPNLFAEEIGLETSRGIANYRSIQSLYQAWRIWGLVKHSATPRVLEIGAGLGRTAYYAMQMGVSRYTIIDIPLTNAAQGYFLGRCLGEQHVALWDEVVTAPVRILPPVAYAALDEKFDLVVNVDSLTEMAEPTAREYMAIAPRLAPRFLSINHEHNAFTVESLYRDDASVRAYRAPSWTRRGYVEELLEFPQA
jgi:hypothetical protein